MDIRGGELLDFKSYILFINVYIPEARAWRNKNGVMLVNSIAHFIWQTLLASLIFDASQLLCSCSLLLYCLLDMYEVIEQETILLTSYKLQLRALRILLAVLTLSASRPFYNFQLKLTILEHLYNFQLKLTIILLTNVAQLILQHSQKNKKVRKNV